MTLKDYLHREESLQNNPDALTDEDLAHLADWASECQRQVPNPHHKRGFALIREGSDFLLRRRAMSRSEMKVSENYDDATARDAYEGRRN